MFTPSDDEAARLYGPAAPKPRQLSADEYLASLAAGKVSYVRDVKPIIDSRCVVCHGCYDGPCQLKLESPEALDRGASKTVIFDGARLKPIAPVRMGMDASTTAQWRNKGFFPVLNERRESVQGNLDNSVLARMLVLKRDNPLPVSGMLSDDFDFDLDRSLECPMPHEFDAFARKHPGWGMPYGFPGLTQTQHQTVMDWVSQGARYPVREPLPANTLAAVDRWESFMNGSSPKEQLVARYVYEHLFMGHLHFKGHDPGEFFRLVRSTTPPGSPIHEISTVRPYDDPGKFLFYRLKPFQLTIVDKNHDVYEIGDERIRRLQALFLKPDYAVNALPGYLPGEAANPFRVFQAIPPESRYRFMLDDAHYFVSGFMKGPVCRGQVALNVIRDQFWVVFYDPATDQISRDAGFLQSEANLLSLPGEKGDSVALDDVLIKYTKTQKRYLKAKNDFLSGLQGNQRNSLDALWDGDRTNPNAALTGFRHFDSASLMWGFVGAQPQTVWAVDYPLFERIHYLLVAGFNVFGAVTHQAATRLYMDNLRMEAENNFLSFYPAAVRPVVYRQWNRGFLSEINSALLNPYYGYGKDTAVAFRTSDYSGEVFDQMQRRLGPLAGPPVTLYRCSQAPCNRADATPLEVTAERELKRLTFLQGGSIQFMPELSFLRIHDKNAAMNQGTVYSLVQNKALANVSFMFLEQTRRLPEEDTLTIVPGFAGSYPNFYFDADIHDLPDFVDQILSIRSQNDMGKLVDRFGIRRTRPDFWAYSDFFNRTHMAQHPVTAGIFDLGRYENR